MRSLIVVLFLCIGVHAVSFGQCYSQTALIYGPTAITGTVVTPPDDGFTPAIPIGFSFCFYGASYDSLMIGTNGLIAFSPTTGTWAITTSIPSPFAVPLNCIMMPWQDLNSTSGVIAYATVGVSPNRCFVVDFSNVPMYACTTLTFTGQVKLFETTNVIETHIGNKSICTGWNGGRAIHALHNIQGMMASVVPGRNSPTAWTTTNEGLQFIPICNVCQGSGFAESDLNGGFEVFPNPSTGIFQVSSTKEEFQSLKIYNTEGKLLLEEIISKGQMKTELDLRGFSSGVYYLEIKTKTGVPVYRKLLLSKD